MSDEFFRTPMGRRFYQSTMPDIADSLATLNRNLAALIREGCSPAPNASAPRPSEAPRRVIGVDTVYVGEERPGLTGQRVRICAVWRDEVGLPDDGSNGSCFFDDDVLASRGGVTIHDRIYIGTFQPNGRLEGRLQAVRAPELALFSDLATFSSQPGGGAR